MMLLGTSVGAEVNGKDLRFAVIRNVGKKLRLVRTFDAPGFADLSPEEQKAALAGLVKANRLPVGRVCLTLPRDRGLVRQIEFPAEVGGKLASAVTLQIEALSPWPADEVYWDFGHEPARRDQRMVRATVAIIPRETLDPWIALFQSAGLPLSFAALAPLSFAHSVGTLWPQGAPVVVLDCELEHVDGCLVQGGQRVAVTHPESNVTAAARSVVERLLAAGRLASADSVRLLVCGPASSSLEGLEHVALPIEASPLDSSTRFGAIAAALSGLGRSAFKANLIPKPLRYRRNHLQLIPTYVLLALAALLGAALAAREPYQQMAYASQLDSEIQRIAPAAGDIVNQRTELNRLSERYRALSSHFQNRDRALEALRELASILPASAWTASFNYLDGVITLSGFADSSSEVQKIIEDSPLFRDAQTSGVTRDARGKDRFTLKASVEVLP